MKKRNVFTSLIIIFILLAASCEGGLIHMEKGSNVNELIYPYLRFTESSDGTYCTAEVLPGARVENIYIPGLVIIGSAELPVREFGGFGIPEDAVDLRKVILDERVEKVADDAFEFAEKLESITTKTESDVPVWAHLPVIEKEGKEFLGWFAGDVKVEEGMPVDPANPAAEPRWRDHRYIEHEGKAPTCTEHGWKPYVTCETCDYSTYEEIPALGHEFRHVERKDPTCTESGYIEHWVCDRCGWFFSSDDPEMRIESVVLPAAGHRLKEYGAKAPTCTGIGYEAFSRCSVCGKYFRTIEGVLTEVSFDDIRIDMVPHSYETEWSYDAGYHWHECSVCGDRKDRAPHEWGEGTVIVAPTGNAPGKVEYECMCGAKKTETVEPENHSFEEIAESRKEPTCTEDGWQDYICTECGLTYRKVLPELGHDAVFIERKEPTCQEEGHIAHWHCARCGGNFTDVSLSEESRLEENGEKLTTGHVFTGEWKSDDTGHWKECDFGCGTKSEVIPHELIEVVSPEFIRSSRCLEPDTYWKSCECGWHSSEEYFEVDEVNGHFDIVRVERVEPTCTTDGNIEYWHCNICGRNYRDEALTDLIEDPSGTVLPHSHKWDGSWSIVGDAHQKVCSVCGEAFGPLEEHIWQQNHDDDRHWDECTVCHAKRNAEAHTWVTVGGHTYCSGCGAEMGQNIDQGGFDVEEEVTVPSGTMTYTESGGTYTFTFMNGNPKYPPTSIMWFVDDVRQKETGNTFTLLADSPRSYTVMCVFVNDGGVGSASETVTGSNL